MDDQDEAVKKVVERMKRYLARFDELSAFASAVTTKEQKFKARELLKSLKADMKKESKLGERNHDVLPDAEKQFYYPAILNAHATLRVSAATDPRTWYADLESARLDISYPLQQLKDDLEAK